MEETTSSSNGKATEKYIKTLKRRTLRRFTSEEKIRIVLMGMRGEEKIAVLCRQYGIAESLYYKWSKDFMEAGKKRLAGDFKREASTTQVKKYREELEEYKHMVAEQAHEIRRLKKTLHGNT